MPDSDAPFAVEQRHVLDGSLRRSVLATGDPAQLLRFAEVHRYDTVLLERAISAAGQRSALRAEAEARLEALEHSLAG